MSYEIDATDRRILHILQKDAKVTIKEIADEIGMSITPVFERIKKLEEEQYIKGYATIVDHEKIGFALIAFCTVTLERHSAEYIEEFECAIAELKEVLECYHIAGLFDYVLKIYARDMNDYQQFVTTKLAAIPNIGRVQSSFIMTEVKNERVLPIA